MWCERLVCSQESSVRLLHVGLLVRRHHLCARVHLAPWGKKSLYGHLMHHDLVGLVCWCAHRRLFWLGMPAVCASKVCRRVFAQALLVQEHGSTGLFLADWLVRLP